MYFWGEQAIYALSIRQQGSELLKLTSRQEIDADFSYVLNCLQQKTATQVTPTTYAQSAHRLFKQLLAPDLPTELLLIPDGALARLPFEALVRKEPSESVSWRSLPYLVVDKAISYAWSYSLWLQTRAPEQGRVLVISPQKFQDLASLSQGKKLVSKLTSMYGSQTTAMIAEQAQKNQFLSAIAEKQEPLQILHFHTHAQADPSSPTESWISFQEEKMYLYELYYSQLDASLAVLGACETAEGQLQIGEGVMSFARGFTHAGCQSVVATLWASNESSTTEILVQFYEALSQGKSKRAALTQSKRSFLQDNSSRPNIAYHPRNWASLVLIGNDDAFPSSTSYWPWAIVICLLIVAVWVWKKN